MPLTHTHFVIIAYALTGLILTTLIVAYVKAYLYWQETLEKLKNRSKSTIKDDSKTGEPFIDSEPI